jgi:hypothetical protein
MRNFPLLLIPVTIYNVVASLGLDLNARVVWASLLSTFSSA